MTTPTARSDAGGQEIARVMTLAWTLKRALIGLVLFVVVVGGTALILHAAIDPDGADSSGGEQTLPIVAH